jgi:hypothetical protein
MTRNAYKILFGKPGEEIHVGSPSADERIILKVHLKGIGFEDVNWRVR